MSVICHGTELSKEQGKREGRRKPSTAASAGWVVPRPPLQGGAAVCLSLQLCPQLRRSTWASVPPHGQCSGSAVGGGGTVPAAV